MTAVRLRRAVAADAPSLGALASRLAEFELPPWRTADEIAGADLRAMLAALETGGTDEEVVVAERDGEPVGCLHVLLTTDFFGYRHAHISVVATTAAAEGSGVGRALLDYAEEWARARSISLLTLNVFAGNARARRVYERAGFVPELLRYTKRL